MSSNVDLYVPRYSTLSVSQFLLSNISGTVFSNTGAFTAFSNLLTVSGTQLWLKTGVYNTGIASPRYSFADQSGNTYNLRVEISAYPMTVSGNTTLYQYEPATITVQPTAFPVGYWSNVTLTNFTLSLNDVFSSNSYISPALSPGLSLGTPNPSNGLVSITGTPTAIRTSATTHFYYARDSAGRSMSQAIPISVQTPRLIFSNVSGTTVTSANQLDISLTYGVFNDARFSVSPVPAGTIEVSSLPAGLSLTLASSNVLRISGVAAAFADNGLVSTLTIPSANFSGSGNVTFRYSPAVELCNIPASVTRYSNVPSTFISNITAISQPVNRTISWGLLNAPDTLTLSYSGNTASLVGTISENVIVTIAATDLTQNVSYSVSSYLIAAPDTVRFIYGSGPLSVSMYQDINYNSLDEFLAQSDSGQEVTYSSPNTDLLGAFDLYLGSATGVVDGLPGTPGSGNVASIVASTPQGVSASRVFQFSVLSNQITFDPSRNFLDVSAHFIQGRPIELNYTSNQRTYRATASSGNNVTQFTTPDISIALDGIGIFSNRELRGTALAPFTRNVTVTGAYATVSGTLTVPYRVDPDQLILAQPTQTDFVLALGSSESYQLQAFTYSGIGISGWSLSGSHIGVALSSSGVLSLTGVSVIQPTPFTIRAETFTGITVSRTCTLTVNAGTFVSPTATSALLPPGSSIVGATDPATSLTLSGLPTGFTFSANTLSNTNGTVYPPQLSVFQSSLALNYPLRVATETLQISTIPANIQWIQYVPIEPITLSGTSPTGGPVYFACPSPPAGLQWDPIRATLTGSPRILTIGDTFTIWATDGYTTAAQTVSFRVRVPSLLRPFTSPSGYTQYVRQRAVVNSAAHAINKTAYLPDPLITSQGGSYPPDLVKPDYACKDGLVYYF